MSLADAIIEEQIETVYAMLQAGVPVNETDEYGFTPLIEAAIADNEKIAELLINHGADVTQQDMTGNTALHWAAENNNMSLCELLLKNHAGPNAYNFAGQPVLVMPFLRQQTAIKNKLLRAGASLEFTQDYVNAKFAGHLFELVGSANIVDPGNNFVEIDFEGFYPEVTLAMIAESLAQFKNHFAARKTRRYSNLTQITIDVIHRAAQLIRYQQYRVDIKKYQREIDVLLQQDPLLIPVGYEGHAITFVRLGDMLVKCDRREDSRLYDNIVIYRMNRPSVLSIDFIKQLIYEKQNWEFINNDLPMLLELEPITELKVSAQVSGNCSWANVEACIPVLFFLLSAQTEGFQDNIPRYKNLALDFFQQWREWNKDRTLQFCIQAFRDAGPIRKACKAEILAAILFQCCNDNSPLSRDRAESILSVLMVPQYEHILQNYIRSYCYEDYSEEGKRFLQMLKTFGYNYR